MRTFPLLPQRHLCLVMAGVAKATTLRICATATPSAPSTTTAARTIQATVQVRPAVFHLAVKGSLLFHSISFWLSVTPGCFPMTSAKPVPLQFVGAFMICCSEHMPRRIFHSSINYKMLF